MNKINVNENLNLVFTGIMEGQYQERLAVLLTTMVLGEGGMVISVSRSTMNETQLK